MDEDQTGYRDTFIAASADSPAQAQLPEDPASIAAIEHALLTQAPGTLTSDELLYAVYRRRKGVADTPAERTHFFATEHPCLRASPLGKRYGWGFVFDDGGRITLVARGTAEYDALLERADLRQLIALRSSRAMAPAA